MCYNLPCSITGQALGGADRRPRGMAAVVLYATVLTLPLD